MYFPYTRALIYVARFLNANARDLFAKYNRDWTGFGARVALHPVTHTLPSIIYRGTILPRDYEIVIKEKQLVTDVT